MSEAPSKYGRPAASPVVAPVVVGDSASCPGPSLGVLEHKGGGRAGPERPTRNLWAYIPSFDKLRWSQTLGRFSLEHLQRETHHNSEMVSRTLPEHKGWSQKKRPDSAEGSRKQALGVPLALRWFAIDNLCRPRTFDEFQNEIIGGGNI